MAKKIRFPLKMANGTDVRTIEELRTNFDLTAVLGYYADGKLLTWLRDRFYDSEADKIEALDKDSKSFQSDLCAALGVAVSAEGEDADSGELDMDYIHRRNEKRRILRELTDDEQIIYNVDSVALNQDDLLDLYDEGKKTIYLCQGEFEIPLSVTDVTYIGVSDPVVTIRVTDNVNFKEKNIKFENLCYGWDISSTTPNDSMRRAEYFFNKGDCQKAADILKDLVERENPRAIMLAYLFNSFFSYSYEKVQYYQDKSKQSQEIFNVIDHAKSSMEKYFPLLKKLADKGDAMSEFFYAWALDKEREYKNNAKEKFEYYCKYVKPTKEYYRRSGDKGNVWAILVSHQWGYGQPKLQEYKEKTNEWHIKAAEMGCSEAQFLMWEAEYEKDEEKRVEWLIKSAEQENVKAQFELAKCYYYGIDIEKDEEEAFKLYAKAVTQVPPSIEAHNLDWIERRSAKEYIINAKIGLADCYCYGNGVEKNDAKAVEWLIKAANLGSAEAQAKLGNAYCFGDMVEKDDKKAIEWLEKAVENGSSSAKFDFAYLYCCNNNYKEAFSVYVSENKERHRLYGHMLFKESEIRQNHEKVIEWFKSSAIKGDSDSQCKLGDCYYYGITREMEKDYSKSVEWYTKAADQGNATAQYKLARCYYSGYGVDKDTGEYLRWLIKAAENRDSEALSELLEYKDDEADTTELIKFLTRLADQGNANAQLKLADCYESGLCGVEQNMSLSNEWCIKAAENGNEDAFDYLCMDYEDAEDYESIFKLCIEYSNKGNARATEMLGYGYYEGEVVEKDIKKALEYLLKAEEQGLKISSFDLEDIALEID